MFLINGAMWPSRRIDSMIDSKLETLRECIGRRDARDSARRTSGGEKRRREKSEDS